MSGVSVDCESKTTLKIGNKWINVEVWKGSHPGGAAAIERLDGADCTEMFYSLHSKEAIEMVNNMKGVGPPKGFTDSHPSVPNATSLSFRAFREELVKEGWFERNWLWDAFYLSVMLSLCVLGTYIRNTHPFLSVFFIGLGMQQAGWIGHDYTHARGKAAPWIGVIPNLITGFSPRWWSEKHNTHHVHTNQKGIDLDIQNDPILHLHIPTEENDYWFRRYQHYYYHFAYSFLYASWRIQSFQHAWGKTNQFELLVIGLNAVWLSYLGFWISIGSILFGGWLVAEVVTATHQSEEMLEGISYQFAEDQFRTTRNVHTSSWLMNWFWGGMQWQLEHHLFPTMPKYRYMAVSKKLQKWAEDNNVEYRTSSIFEILVLNFQTMKQYASVSVADFKALSQASAM
jgi:fatty acid desaturase